MDNMNGYISGYMVKKMIQAQERMMQEGNFKKSDNYEIWLTQDGRRLKISEMNEVHIQNCINMLQRQLDEINTPKWNEKGFIDTTQEILDAVKHKTNYIESFQKELKKRLDKPNDVCYNNYSKENNSNTKSKGDNNMKAKSTGIVRRIDDLGRIVVPKEIRRKLGIREGDPLEIFLTENGVELRKDPIAARIVEADRILRNMKGNVTFICEDNNIICLSKVQTRRGYVAKTGVAMCNPTDTFNEKIGRAIAYLRMIGETPSQVLTD